MQIQERLCGNRLCKNLKRFLRKTTKNETNLCPPSRTSWYCNVYTLIDHLKLVVETQNIHADAEMFLFNPTSFRDRI